MKLFFVVALIHATTFVVDAQAPSTEDTETVKGSLNEIKGKARAQLLIVRPGVLDASDPAKAVVEAVRNGAHTERRHRYAYFVIAKKLNDYIRKYGSLSNADDLNRADYVIVFNLLRYRHILYSIYPSGEMYVVSYRPPGPARILWKTEKEMLAEDAANSLIKALKVVYGQH